MKTSAGLLLYRRRNGLEVFLVHPGGPYWARKDLGAWSIPKGEVAAGEDPLSAARREFSEETGHVISGNVVPLAPVKQAGGKLVQAWAVEGDCDPATCHSTAFSLEWPPKSGHLQEFPEVDRFAWFDIAEGRRRILPSQAGLLDQLSALVDSARGGASVR